MRHLAAPVNCNRISPTARVSCCEKVSSKRNTRSRMALLKTTETTVLKLNRPFRAAALRPLRRLSQRNRCYC